ncbi:MAG: prolipoprotein diacylglyceryl transferase [Oligoflexia bacterium]|nr:prolipoprotein diacylglyceryl transferase [Oligoflexia bacterium]
MPYPQIDPVIFQIGPIAPRWYGLMYLLGFLYTFRLLKKHHRWMGLDSSEKADSILATLVLGMIICSRFVYVVFYNWKATMAGPWYEPFAIWHGGLAFHGGLLGTILASVYVARKYQVPWLRLTDILALSTPVGLGLGRIANFINGELWGRVTDLPWGMVFPGAGDLPRHPSQIYEFLLEGVVLFIILQVIWRYKPRVGVVSSSFLLFYALFRTLVEFVREPDAQVGFLFGGVTMGQILSSLMFIGGFILLRYATKYGENFDAKQKSTGKKK